MKNKLSFDLIDFEELMWDAYRRHNTNQNNFSYWYPIIANKNSKFKTPNSTILTFNKYQYDLMTEHYEKESLVDEFYEMMRYRFTNELSDLDRTKRLFIKNGTYSNKFDFQTCLIEVGDSDDVIIEKSEIINYDSMLKSAGGYGEFVIREYIEGENVDTIYNGMPLRTEFRVFYDFDKHQVMDVVNYWDVDFMLSKGYFEFPDDAQTLKNNKDRINEDYTKHKPKIIEHVKENIDKKTRLDGQWSIDFMLANGEYWLIDMALAHNSAYFTGENHNLYKERTTMIKPHKGTIENWHVISMINACAIVGIIDGKRIRTSEIVTLEDNKVETLNSIYQLGEPLLEDSEVLDKLRVILDNKGETE